METAFKVGGKVVVPDSRFVGVWTITKVNSVTLGLEQNGARLMAHKSVVEPATADAEVRPTIGMPFVEALPFQPSGAFVRYVGRGNAKLPKDSVMVVLQDKGDKVKVTMPGGSGGTGWGIQRRSLEAVKVKVEVV